MSKNHGRATQYRPQRIINLPSTFIETDSHYLKYRSTEEALHDVENALYQVELRYLDHVDYYEAELRRLDNRTRVDVTEMYALIDDLRIACARLERLVTPPPTLRDLQEVPKAP